MSSDDLSRDQSDPYENKARLGRIVLDAAEAAIHDDSDPDLARINAIRTCEAFVSDLAARGCMITRIPGDRHGSIDSVTAPEAKPSAKNLSDEMACRGAAVALRLYNNYGRHDPREPEYRESAVAWLREALIRLEERD